MRKINVGILGSGNIGCDLLMKAKRSDRLNVILMAGRRQASEGLAFSQEQGIKISSEGVCAILDNVNAYDAVFDATSANDHMIHCELFKNEKLKLINLTPSVTEQECIPSVNLTESMAYKNISMATCGAQAASPIAHAISKVVAQIDYLEAVTTISTVSAGMATRKNIDEYLDTTEKTLQIISGCPHVKSILNINPAVPCIKMQVTVYAKMLNFD